MSHLVPPTKLWGRDSILLATTSKGSAWHTADTQHMLNFFLLKIFILFPGKIVHSSFKTPSLLWSFPILVPSRISGSHCTHHNKFSLFCVSAFSIRLATSYSLLCLKQLAMTDTYPVNKDMLNNQMSSWYFCISNKLLIIDV